MCIGRGWDRVGAHTKGYNDNSIAISFMGNYMIVPPTDRMLTAAQELIQCGIDPGESTFLSKGTNCFSQGNRSLLTKN